jgi:hypothetical protein
VSSYLILFMKTRLHFQYDDSNLKIMIILLSVYAYKQVNIQSPYNSTNTYLSTDIMPPNTCIVKNRYSGNVTTTQDDFLLWLAIPKKRKIRNSRLSFCVSIKKKDWPKLVLQMFPFFFPF